MAGIMLERLQSYHVMPCDAQSYPEGGNFGNTDISSSLLDRSIELVANSIVGAYISE